MSGLRDRAQAAQDRIGWASMPHSPHGDTEHAEATLDLARVVTALAREVERLGHRVPETLEAASEQVAARLRAEQEPPTVVEQYDGPTVTGHVEAVASCPDCIRNGMTGCASAEDVIAGRASYADTAGGQADVRIMAADRVEDFVNAWTENVHGLRSDETVATIARTLTPERGIDLSVADLRTLIEAARR